MDYPRVLVISHTVFSDNGNMGKTMSNLLSVIPKENLAQLYFHSEIPTLNMCERYFRVTDRNILQSVFTRKGKYKIFHKEDIREGENSRTDTGLVAKIYQFSRRRTPLIYCARNMIWKLGIWESTALHQWIKEFCPDVLFFASGDYSFAYRIVYKIAKKYHLPVVMWCCDEHYLSRKKTMSPLYHINKHILTKWAKKVASCSSTILTISDKMQKDYEAFFKKKVALLRISASPQQNDIPLNQRQGIVYAGNLGVNRIEPLLELSKALVEAKIPGLPYIDVYSGERDEKKLALLTKENGIRFHGAVPSSELNEILKKAKYLLHVEAFDETSKLRTRYSLSTKIGESLQSGVCFIAYGPEDISSIEYLKNHDAAIVLKQATDLVKQLTMLTDEQYMNIVDNAKKLADKCHNKDENDKKILSILTNT